ncbi:MAG: lysoplasmalogenase [Actinobacteria bacterium]|nr:lysoplasmalogenase [Actinomycetota bacterium]
MTTSAGVLLGLAAVAALGDWVAVSREHTRLEHVCKPLALALLVGVAATLDPASSDQRTAFVIALVLSLIGDVALMLPSDRFVVGLGAFLLGHLAYIVGFGLLGGDAPDYLLGAVIVSVPAVLLARRYVRALASTGRRELIPPVVLYVAAIGAMVASAIAVGNEWAVIGATLFLVSDTLIAETRFGGGSRPYVGPRPHGRVAIMVTYHLAQAALVVSLLP